MRTKTSTNEWLAIGLGSNLGDREAHLSRAIVGLEKALGTLRIASLYENAALPLPDTGPSPLVASDPLPPFLNTVVVATRAVTTDLHQLLSLARGLEQRAGRLAAPRWAPRTLDVDILVVGNRVSFDPELTLPHAGLRNRRFVLVPLAEVAPDLPIPPDGKTAAALSAALPPDGHPLDRHDWRPAAR